MSVPFSAPGMTVERSRLTRLVVALSAGPCLEIALKNAVVPALSICIGVIAATPEAEETSFCSVCSRGSVVRGSLWELLEALEEEDEEAGWAGVPSEVAMINGPLVPGPKYFESRS